MRHSRMSSLCTRQRSVVRPSMPRSESSHMTSRKSLSTQQDWHQSRFVCQTLNQRYAEYWSETIAANVNDSKVLWLKINVLLKTPQSATSVIHTADDFANFFTSKINNIRQVTVSAPPPAIAAILCGRLSSFDDVTAEEVSRIVSN